jgi:hypothetical protein
MTSNGHGPDSLESSLRVRRYVDGELVDVYAMFHDQQLEMAGADAEWARALNDRGYHVMIVVDDPARHLPTTIVIYEAETNGDGW